MKTRQEIEKLKAEWREDQGWDLAETEDFEEHAAELGLYQAQVEAEQRAEAARQHEEAVQKLITTAIAILPERACDNEIGQPIARTDWSTVNVLLRLMAEMVIPLQVKVERHERTIAEHVETIKDLQHDLDRHIGRPT